MTIYLQLIAFFSIANHPALATYSNLDLSGGLGNGGNRPERRLRGQVDAEWDLPTPVRNLTFTPDGKKLVTANGDTTPYLIDLPDAS